MSNDDLFLRQAENLSRQIGRRLKGKDSKVQGAVLAELTAIWLGGHWAGSADATTSLRAEILSLHCATVRKLVRLADEEAP